MGVLKRPAGADAARVLAVGIVGWYHIWQQSWVSPGPLEPLVRGGYVWVDMMILLSAFCLTLPYAFDWAEGKPFRGCEGFYRRRLVRILPGYYLCLGVHFAVALAVGGADWRLAGDLAAHLTLTQTCFLQSYWFTRLGGALWTVGVLAGFYLLFPLLIRTLWRCPLGLLGALAAVQAAFGLFARGLAGNDYLMAFNRLPAFAGVLGLGMGGALLYAKAALVLAGRYRWLFAAGAALAAVAIFGLVKNSLLDAADNRRWQLEWRMPLAGLFLALLLCLCLCMGQSGGLLRWLAGASYGFYLWHQSVAVWLKQARIPFWEGEVPPNQRWDTVWMTKYNLLCWGAALAVSAAAWLAEKRLTAWIQRRKNAAKTA